MQLQSFKTTISAEQLKPVIELPENFAGQMLEIIIRPLKKNISFFKPGLTHPTPSLPSNQGRVKNLRVFSSPD